MNKTSLKLHDFRGKISVKRQTVLLFQAKKFPTESLIFSVILIVMDR